MPELKTVNNRFQSIGISGSVVFPNLRESPEWRQCREKLSSQLKRHLSKIHFMLLPAEWKNCLHFLFKQYRSHGSLPKIEHSHLFEEEDMKSLIKTGSAQAIRLFLLIVTTTVLFSIGITSSVVAVEQWEWTADNPKPDWWTWGEDYWSNKPVRGGYFRTAALRYIGLMNPNHWPVNDWVNIKNFYGSIVYSDGNYKPTIPWQAKSWKLIDQVTAEITFRKGIQFHDGSTFNASTFKYQLEWIMDKKNGCWDRGWLEPIKSLEVVDEYRLRFNFKRPWAGFIGIMQSVPGMPISAEALKKDNAIKDVQKLAKRIKTADKKVAKAQKKAEKSGTKKAKSKVKKEQKKLAKLKKQHRKLAKLAEGAKSVDLHPAGNGPYMLEKARPGNYLRIKRNPKWWFGQSIGRPEMPYFDGIHITVIPDPAVQLANLRARKIDHMGVDKSQYSLIKNDKNLQITVVPQNNTFGFMFNHTSKPLKDIRVRMAVSHAIDRKALIAGTQFGLARIASCMFPGDHWTHNPNLKPVKYDPELSKRLLAEAGYPDGLTLRGTFGNDPAAQSIATAAKNMWAKVGIDWDVRFLDWAAINDNMRALDYDLIGLYWMFVFDPDLISTGLYHPDGGFNFGRSNNKKAVELVMAGRKEVDVEKRKKTYQELEKLLYDNYEDVWVWWDVWVTAYSRNLQGGNINVKMYLKGREAYYYSHQMWFKDGKP